MTCAASASATAGLLEDLRWDQLVVVRQDAARVHQFKAPAAVVGFAMDAVARDPGSSPTMARRFPRIALNRVDFPTLGRPTMTPKASSRDWTSMFMIASAHESSRTHVQPAGCNAIISFHSRCGSHGKQSPLKPAICAYSFREALKAKTMTYEDLIRLTADLGAEGVDMTVYWFPDTSDQFLNSVRRTAYKSCVSIYSIAIRSVMTQPTPELR
jgi:hypothetical protein